VSSVLLHEWWTSRFLCEAEEAGMAGGVAAVLFCSCFPNSGRGENNEGGLKRYKVITI
jgi:hypothetical protein